MNKLLQIHDKVKYHRYRDDIVENSAYYKRYVNVFNELLDVFRKEIDAARQISVLEREISAKMLVELDNRCFMIDAAHKLSVLYTLGEEYHHTGSYDTEQQIRILMAQLEGTLSSIHEYIATGKVGFLLRYPSDDSMEVVRLVWKGTDYVPAK